MTTLFLHQALEERKAMIYAYEEKQRLTRRETWRKRTLWKQIKDFVLFWFTFKKPAPVKIPVPVCAPSNPYLTLKQYLREISKQKAH